MALLLEIIQGARKGSRFKVRNGLKFGRKHGDVVLTDPKISGRHAHIEERAGEMILLDDQSSNGIRLNGKRVPHIALIPGLQVQMGDTHFLVIDENAPPIGVQNTKTTEFPPPIGAPTGIPRAPEPEPAPPPLPWKQVLGHWLTENMGQVKDRTLPITAFRQPLHLEFIQGIQLQTIWEIGYGPRQIGAKSFEFSIAEPEAPDVCFELIPTKQGVIFRTNSSDKVRLNDKEVTQDFLNEGDIIAIGDSRIQIGFRK